MSPSWSCFLDSSNWTACQRKWKRCIDISLTDLTNSDSNSARLPQYLTLSKIIFCFSCLLSEIFSVSPTIKFFHWDHVTTWFQSTSGFCLIIDSCNFVIPPQFLHLWNIQLRLCSKIVALSCSNSNLLQAPFHDSWISLFFFGWT